jgi:hypothetical protein
VAHVLLLCFTFGSVIVAGSMVMLVFAGLYSELASEIVFCKL